MTDWHSGIRPQQNNFVKAFGVRAMEGKVTGGEKENVNKDSPSGSSQDGALQCEVCGSDEIDCDPVEDSPVTIARDPGNPTEHERELHCATHIPYRAWCPICVKAKGKEEPHRSQRKKEASCKPTISLDYKSFGQEIDFEDKATAVVGKDEKTKIKFAHICETKGSSDLWAVEKLGADLDRLGYTDVILKSDGEPAIIQLLEELKKRRAHPTIIQHPPAYDPQANGAAENAVQAFMGEVRALKIGLEARLKIKIQSDWAIIEWMLELACELLNRCAVGLDGRTPYYRLYGKNSSKPILEFGSK